MMQTPDHLEAMVTNIRPRPDFFAIDSTVKAPETATSERNDNLARVASETDYIDVLGNPFRSGIIIQIFAENSIFTYDALMSKRRFQKLVNDRQILMWILKKTLDVSYPRIGTLVGGRDHSTVMNAMQKVYANEDMLERALDVMEIIWKDERLKFGPEADVHDSI